MRRKAFTLIEVIIAIGVMAVMAASITLSAGSAKHTAKFEAERIVTQLYRIIETANKRHVSFKVLFNGNEQTKYVDVEWQTPETSQRHHIGYDREIKITNGYSIKNLNNTSSLSSHNLVYNIKDNSFLPPSMTLQVTGKDNSVHYIIIYVPGTRIRTSNSRP